MFRHILVPLDGSLLAECVLPHALEAARAFTARLTVLHVLERPSNKDGQMAIDPLDWRLTKAEAEAYLEGVAVRLREVGVEVRSVCTEGRPAERVIEYAHRNGVNLIALSSHGQSGLSGWNVSSVVQKIILRAHISTLLVRAYQPGPEQLLKLRYQRLVVTLDCSNRAECVLPLARVLARYHLAEVALTHVVQRPEMPRRTPLSAEDRELSSRVVSRNSEEARNYMDHLQVRLAPDISNLRSCLLVQKSAAVALHEMVRKTNADLVVMSAHGHSGGSRWPYGSVAVSFIVYGNTPLLIVQDLTPEDLDKYGAEVSTQEIKGH